MANKRIELEQYKYFVDLIEEQPNRKRMRKGIAISMVVAMLLSTLMIVLGFMSNELAKNPRNVLEKPPEKSKTQTPNVQPGQIPSPQNQSQPGGVPIPQTPQPGGQGEIPSSNNLSAKLSSSYKDTVGLLAQAEPQSSSPSENMTVPQEKVPPKVKAKEKRKSLGEETKGVGNLANLANGIDGRGFDLYLLCIYFILVIVFYLVIKRSRREGK